MNQTIYSTAALRWCIKSATVVFILAVTQSVYAVEFDGNFTVGASRTDNIALVSEDATDETVAQFGANLNFTQASRRLTADFRSTVTYYDYLDGTFEDETVAAAVALFDFNVIDNVLQFAVTDNYGRTLFNPFEAARPENQENVNIFTAGPNLTFFQGARNDAGLDVIYTNTYYEIRPFDNEQFSGRIYFGRELRENHNLSLNLAAETIEFDNGGLTPDVDRDSVFFRYRVRAARTDIDLDIGFSEQEIFGGTSERGVLLDFNVDRQITSNSRLTFLGGSRFADQSDVFRLNQDASRDIDDFGDVTETGAPFRLNNVGIGYSLQAGRTIVGLNFGLAEQDYEDQPGLDRKDANIALFVSRDFSRSLFGIVDILASRREFETVSTEDDTIIGSVSLGYRFMNSLSASLRLSRNTRDASDPTNDFDENRVQLLFTYTPRWAQR